MNNYISQLPRIIRTHILKPHHTQTISTMTVPYTGTPTPVPPPAGTTSQPKKPSQIPKGKTELKILMLHGYTQSGPVFSSKTKALSKLLVKAMSPAPYNLHPTLIFPTAPIRLRASDIPGSEVTGEEAQKDDEDNDSWAWFRKDEATNTYRGLDEGMRTIATAIREAGGVDGVCGFSQGAAMAALVASALEEPHREPSADAQEDNSWLPLLRAANDDKPLKFCVIYSGFYAPPENLQWLYTPHISTPTLHFVGSLDTVVEESRSQGLIDRCVDPTVIVHPGGHYVPVAKDWVLVLVGWLRKRYEDPSAAKEAL